MEVLRTPDACFDALDGYPFAPRYVSIPDLDGGELRVHVVDEGPEDGHGVVLLHGNPTWSYSYRFVIPRLARAGYRVLAPDLVGLGRSDKPATPDDYTYGRHLEWLRATIDALDVRDATLVGQDWGGILAMSLLDVIGDRFARVMVSNTGVYRPDLEAPAEEEAATLAWVETARTIEVMPVGAVVAAQSTRGLTPAEIAGYDAPYPSEAFKVGVRTFPRFIPTLPAAAEARAASAKAWTLLSKWEKPFLVAFSDQDPLVGRFAEPIRACVPGAQAQPVVVIEGAKHFVQDDQPEAMADAAIAFIRRTA